MSEIADFLAFAHELADTARGVTLSYFRHPITIEKKTDNSPVTLADKATEALLREKITQRFPEHGIIGEEESNKVSQSDYEWILDPIDGTKSFISGYPLYGTLICLLKNGRPMVSVIDIPALNERYSATINTPTLCAKNTELQQAKTAEKTGLADCLLYSTDYAMFTAEEHRRVAPLRQAVSMVRYNGDCYLYAMLASGWIDVVLEADMKIYDFLPLVLIVEQAGGIITDWQGQPLSKESNGQILACANQTLHQAALSLIQA